MHNERLSNPELHKEKVYRVLNAISKISMLQQEVDLKTSEHVIREWQPELPFKGQ